MTCNQTSAIEHDINNRKETALFHRNNELGIAGHPYNSVSTTVQHCDMTRPNNILGLVISQCCTVVLTLL